MSEAVNITSPVGRIVAGNLYTPNTKAMDGTPLVVKTGVNKGQPRVDYFFAIAIPKDPTKGHWANTEWGAKIWAIGHAAFPVAAQRPDFAWKIDDGDSTVPNKLGKIPNQKEGYPGHWILRFSGGFPPKVFNKDGTAAIPDKDAVKPGYYVQVAFSCAGNEQAANPGVYLNHQLVAFTAYGEEITTGPDAASAGFGQNVTLPPGASATPPAALAAPPVTTAPQTAPPPPGATVAAPPATAVPAVLVTPNTAILTPPAPGAVAAAPPPPAAPVAPPVPVGRQMLPKAAGQPYEAFIAAGWTDVNLIAHGYMAPF